MGYDINDEKLTAYALGELKQADREIVQKALESDASLRHKVAGMRATAKLAAETLKSQPAYALTDSQRDVISKSARTPAAWASLPKLHRKSARRGRVKLDWYRWQTYVVAALVLVVAGLIVVPLFGPQLGVVGRRRQERLAPSMAPPFTQVFPPATGGYGGGGFGGGGYGGYATDVQGMRDGIQFFSAKGIGPTAEEVPGETAGLPVARYPVAAPDKTPPTLEAIQTDRYLIKNASMVIEVEDARKASELLVAAVQELGGYVSDFRESVDPLGRRSISAQVRVPATKFQTAMDRLDPLGKVLNRQVYTEDVTEQYVDTDARLRNLKRTEERLLAHLGRTGKLEDIVKVEHEITRVRGEIESLEGRLRFLSHRIEFSTIIITLQETPRTEPIMPPETFSIGKIASEATRSLVGFLQNLTGTLVWLAVWAVVWVPIVIVVILLIRRGLREARKAEK